jgi:DNA topoisomerase-1
MVTPTHSLIRRNFLSGTKKLVIVESPAKAKTIGKYLGSDYEVLASVGHIRDIPTPKELPADLKKGPFGKFAVNIEDKFQPYYVVSEDSKRTVADLKRALKESDELYLATDEDREGEAIAWHLLEVLKPKVPVKRMVFHEITQEAIEAARENTRELDTALVEAQETRRILDRIYGFEISPVLWRMVGPNLSAGRVQSVAARLIVERERERMAFTAAGYWDLLLTVGTSSDVSSQFEAKLVRLGGAPIASGRDFDEQGKLKSSARALSEAEALALSAQIASAGTTITVTKLETKPYSRKPAAPFTTSTLQQAGVNELKFSSRQTMSVAQRLYENGHITYMRTDSPSLSTQAMNAARSQAIAMYGEDQVSPTPRVYTGKSKNAQEAHEAIRPSGDVFKTPAQLSTVLRGEELKLYELIWKRTVASQMADAKGQTATVTVGVTPAGGELAEFTASGTVITFRGFLNAYEETIDDDAKAQDDDDAKLPAMTEGQALVLADIEAKGHETQPPARYTEASLVKKMEEIGIGRPSTYSSIIETIQYRKYVVNRGKALVPTWIAFVAIRLLEESFSDLIAYDFTAELENDLDRIAAGEAKGAAWLKDFYFGKGEEHPGLQYEAANLGPVDKQTLNSMELANGSVLRIWPSGSYIEVDDPDAGPGAKRKVYLPDDLAPDELTAERIQELIDAPIAGDRVLGINPDNGKEVLAKDGRFGPYVTEREPGLDPDAKPAKERTASLFKSMDPATLDFETALRLLNLPRDVGADPETGEIITAQNGRYGAYLKKGTDTRSLDNEDQIFEIDLAGALEKFAQPKYGARTASSNLFEFDPDPISGKPIKVKDGRFGPYVTDGEINATIPRGDKVDEMTYERAVELLAEKRAKGPSVKRGRASAAKKPAAKKPAAKKAAPKKK